jgi:predicted 2-oxoglutarate/Fe(II)-dependent dioxygenase YbiX/peroxiredoxin
MLLPGDFAPWFQAASSVNPGFCFDTVAGRYVVISFFGSTQIPSSRQFLTEIVKHGDRFDVTNAVFFGVTNDPQDVEGIEARDPGRIYFYDLDLAVSKRFDLVREDLRASEDGQQSLAISRTTFILDEALRVIGVIPMSDDEVPRQIEQILWMLNSMPRPAALTTTPPVLIVPYVFEPDLCRRLIRYYETHDIEDSGFMRDQNGKTVGVVDYSHKRRMDCEIVDQEVIRATQERIRRRVAPAIRQAFQFHATRIERHIVACYDAAQGAHFRAHRDNTTLGTAHRRFAITINLNSPEYEGGEIWFPEFGPKKYKASSGAAIVFSCSLLHEVPPVTRGKRYAFLPFLYDDAAAELRDRNRKHLGDLTAAGKKVTHACDNNPAAKTTPARSFSGLAISGESGCGNPDGCNTCLTSATYPLRTPVPPREISQS